MVTFVYVVALDLLSCGTGGCGTGLAEGRQAFCH